MSPGKILLAVIGGLVGLIATGLLTAGGGLLWGYGSQRTAEGFFTSSAIELSTASYALTSSEVDLGPHPGDWFPSNGLATVRFNVEPAGLEPMFVGIGSRTDVDAYLDGVGFSEVTNITPTRGDVSYRTFEGDAPSSLPIEETFWVASVEGSGFQTLTWELQRGEWKVVIMNSDATPGVTVDASAGAKTDLLVPVGIGLLVSALIAGALAAALLVLALRQPTTAVTGTVAVSGGFGHYPVRLEGRLDPGLSRSRWLFKWFLAIPHLVLLALLWGAFGVLTLVAGMAILFTGRYPRSIFDFNVGVMRWTWRVAFYSYSALGTDTYPPFTLADADYPAAFDVEYPERLSRGLVLVKWWLLAIPHYLIIGLFTTGLIWWSTQIGDSGNAMLQIGGGLIGILVLIAAVALLFTGRYPQGLFDAVVGLNRWVYRVWAYAALMTDEYPPFRLDTGGTELGATPAVSPRGPLGGGDVPVEPDLTRV